MVSEHSLAQSPFSLPGIWIVLYSLKSQGDGTLWNPTLEFQNRLRCQTYAGLGQGVQLRGLGVRLCRGSSHYLDFCLRAFGLGRGSALGRLLRALASGNALADSHCQQDQRDGKAACQPADDQAPPPFPSRLLAGAEGDAVVDEAALGRAEFAAPFGQPCLGGDQRCAAQQAALVTIVGLPLAHGGPQPLLPDAESPVSLDPTAQPLPTADQRLVDDLDRFLTRLIPPGDDQPPVGQMLHQWPILVAQLGAVGNPPRVLSALARLHQLDEDALRRGLLNFW